MDALYLFIGKVAVLVVVMVLTAIVELFVWYWFCAMYQAFRLNRAGRKWNPEKELHRIYLHPIRWVKLSWWLLTVAGGTTSIQTANGAQYPVPFSPFAREGWNDADDDDDGGE